MSRRTLWGCGLLAFALFALVRLPASLLLRAVPAPFQVSGISGTLWEGRATQFGLDGQELVRDLAWQWQPAALLRGQFGWSLNSGNPGTPVTARLLAGFGGLRIEDLNARLPAAPLLALAKPLAPFQLGGTLLINAGRIDRHTLTGTTVLWQDASSLVTPQANPFGNYSIALQRNGDTLDWQLAPQGGRLDISGKGSLGPAGPQGALRLQAADGQATLFAPLLERLPGDGKARTLQLGAVSH
ncbi:type II secretion system protein N [Jeongeupia chitinilytica]|uniref:Type II secretion system protein N n=1 Tax=Jeongeupia chitinilytica TaxID=1041641 RepID=A0ABQ3GVT4_9NEIS|nr:type II secretion system protein N [Jeongeupia chitinilytica]GHD57331.1 hypothetical protein GCM10007350_05850 [Jeongeupia chitinilytica]